MIEPNLPISINSKRPDDEYFRAVFGVQQVAGMLIAHVASKRLRRLLDLKTLKQIPDTYVDKRLRRSLTDLVYTCELRDGSEARLCLLFEHKNSPPGRRIYPQIGRYLVNMQEDDLKNRRKHFTLTIPIIFYHGAEPWDMKQLRELYGTVSRELLEYVPNFKFLMINLQELSREQLLHFKNLTLRSVFLMMKRQWEDEFFRTNKKAYFTFVGESIETEDFLFECNLTYIQNISSLKKAEIMDLATELQPRAVRYRRKKKTPLQEWAEEIEKNALEKGMEKGMEEMLRRFILKNPKSKVEEIAAIFSLSAEEVLRAKQSIEN